MSILSKPYFHDEAAAFAHVESVLWPHGPVCPQCGVINNAYKLDGVVPRRKVKGADGQPLKDENGEFVWKYSPERHGLWKCKDCDSQFTVRIKTIFEESHLPLHKWLQAIYLMCASKKGFSAHQMHRVLEVQYKTAWFLCHRIREAMRSGDLSPFGGGHGDVEVDETFIGTEPGSRKKRGYGHKMKVLSLIDRETKQARSIVMERLTQKEVWPVVRDNVARETRLLTDDAGVYRGIGALFHGHAVVNHNAGEYVRRGEPDVHTNTVEGFFSVFKRGMKGTYQHCSKKHLHRYLAEFDYRYNHRSANGIEDGERAAIALRGVVGKRLTYRSAS